MAVNVSKSPDFRSGSSIGLNGFGYSIDCVIEESPKFYPTPPGLGALRTNPYTSSAGLYRAFHSFSWTSKTRVGQLLKPEWSPQMVYDTYFNAAGVQGRIDRNGRIRGVTSLAYENFRQVMNGPRIGAADKRRLDDYMGLLSQIDKVLARRPVTCGGVSAPTTFANAEALHGAMFDLEVAALACGLTKIAMHAIWHWASDFAANPEESHASAHKGSQVPPGATISIAAGFNRFKMNLVADFMRKLDAVTEPDGSTLLDNTLFIYSDEDGSGGHEHVDLPVLVAGGQGRIRTGYYIDYRPRPLSTRRTPLGRPYNSLLVTAFKAMGFTESDYQKFGRQGFGRYELTNTPDTEHYTPFLGARVNDPLPFLLTT